MGYQPGIDIETLPFDYIIVKRNSKYYAYGCKPGLLDFRGDSESEVITAILSQYPTFSGTIYSKENGKIMSYDGGVKVTEFPLWKTHPVVPASVIVYLDGDYAVAVDGSTKQVIKRSTDHTEVIQAAVDYLSTGGKIYIAGGDYTVGSIDFKGVDYIEIEGCGYKTTLFSNGSDPMFNFSNYSNFVVIRSLRLSALGKAVQMIYSFGKLLYAIIENCYFTEIGSKIGVNIGRGVYVVFAGNIIYANRSEKANDACDVYADYEVVTNNIFIQTAGTGDLLSTAQVKHAVITNNVFRNTTTSLINAIFLQSDLGNISDVVIANNVVDKANIVVRGQTGQAYIAERILIKNNILTNGGNIDVRILNAVSGDLGKLKDVIIEGNILDSGQILLQGVQGVRVHHNDVSGGIVSTSPNDNIEIRRNKGYVTENSGTATITADNTSVTVNHGLAATPTKVLVTPLGDPGAYWYVANITSTTFDIVLSTAPASNVTFAWYAEV